MRDRKGVRGVEEVACGEACGQGEGRRGGRGKDGGARGEVRDLRVVVFVLTKEPENQMHGLCAWGCAGDSRCYVDWEGRSGWLERLEGGMCREEGLKRREALISGAEFEDASQGGVREWGVVVWEELGEGFPNDLMEGMREVVPGAFVMGSTVDQGLVKFSDMGDVDGDVGR